MDKIVKGWKFKVLVVVAIVVLATVFYEGYVLYAQNQKSSKATLVIYTYGSLFNYGANPNETKNIVFGTFEKKYNVNIDIEYPNNIMQALESQKSNPQADIVIGLTNVEAPTAIEKGLLDPYNYTNDIPSFLINGLSNNHYLTPYEYSYLAIDYTMSFYNQTKGNVSHSNFLNFLNSTWAKNLILESPLTDTTGLNFLMWQIAFYEYVLHNNNWLSWWKSIKNYALIENDWSTAFNLFTTTNNPQQLVSSYSTDPAYEIYNNGAMNGTFSYNSTLSYYNNTYYGWETIFGIGIVHGSSHLLLDEEFINWFLSGTVQSQIPLNEWEYPANNTVTLPPAYKYAVNPSNVVPLNNYLTQQQIYSNMTSWLEQWQLAMS